MVVSRNVNFSTKFHCRATLGWLMAGMVFVCNGLFAAESRPMENWSLVGEGRFKFAFWSIYDAYLYTPAGQFKAIHQTATVQRPRTDPSSYVTVIEQLPVPFYLKLRYLRDIDKSDLVENTFDQWRQKQDLDVAKLTQYKNVLNDIWPDNVSVGDSLAILVTANTSQFYFNEAPIGLTLDQNFGFLFAGIWLATWTTEPKLRLKLIGRTK